MRSLPALLILLAACRPGPDTADTEPAADTAGTADTADTADPLDGWISERALGEGVTVIDGPVECPADATTGEPVGCWIMDLAVDVLPDEAGDQGLELRLFVPNDPPAVMPVMLNFPGVGTCGTRDPIDEIEHDGDDMAAGKRTLLAAEGVLQVDVSPRGHRGCYEEGDAFYQTGDWNGEAEFGDYDELLSRLLAANLHADLPAVGPDVVGLSGGSTGGVTTLLFANNSTYPLPFALAMPSVGAPSLQGWLGHTVDPRDDIEALTLAGLFPTAGVQAQLKSYEGTAIDDLASDLLAGDFSDLAAYLAVHTAYDADGSLGSFDAHVRQLTMHTGGRDCIVSTRVQWRFWEQLQAEHSRADDRLIFSIYPHSCKDVTDRFPTPAEESVAGGYFPTWTQELYDDVQDELAWSFVNTVREALLDSPPEVPLPGPVMASPLVQGELHEHSSPWRELSSLGEPVDGAWTLHLQPDGGLAPEPAEPWQAVVIEHDPTGVCDGVDDLLQPCGQSWTSGEFATLRDELETIRSLAEYRLTIEETTTIVGVPTLDLGLDIDTPDAHAFAGAGLVAMLRYTPPDAEAGYHGWHATQGAQFLSRTGQVDLELELDPRIMTLEAGGELVLQLSNLSTYVHHQPWLHPVTGSYSVELLVDEHTPATLTLPTSSGFEALPLADTTSLEG